jgi:hypothetical protein
MKLRFIIYILIILTVVSACVFWLRSSARKYVQEPIVKTEQIAIPPVNGSNAHNVTPVVVSPSTNLTAIESSLHKQLQTTEGFQKYVEDKNIAISFYGKVIDQDGKPIEGANIKAQSREWYVTRSLGVDARFPSVMVVSGIDGKFEIKGIKGDGFGLAYIQRSGYELEPGPRSFSPIGSSYNNPVTFIMWSTNIHEKLIEGNKVFNIVPDGSTYFIKLTDGTITELGEGDLKVWVKRPEQIIYGKRYDWACEVDVLNGGLLAATDSSMYQAPADGYTPTFQFDQKAGSGWGDTTGEKRFYVLLNNGKEYGRITIELMAYYNDKIPGMIRLSYALNPSGSRILR